MIQPLLGTTPHYVHNSNWHHAQNDDTLSIYQVIQASVRKHTNSFTNFTTPAISRPSRKCPHVLPLRTPPPTPPPLQPQTPPPNRPLPAQPLLRANPHPHGRRRPRPPAFPLLQARHRARGWREATSAFQEFRKPEEGQLEGCGFRQACAAEEDEPEFGECACHPDCETKDAGGGG